MKKTLVILILFACSFIIAFEKIPGKWIIPSDWYSSASIAGNYLLGLIPLLAALWLSRDRSGKPVSIGLQSSNIGRGFLLALVFTLPMFVGYGLTGQWNDGLSLNRFLITVVIAGLFEELFFRGFFFGLLFRYRGWGFVPAMLLNALPFGLLHIYQGHDVGSSLAAFGITAAGALLYCWLYAEWRYNLWLVIFLHMLMNCSWILFKMSPGAAGNLNANIFRAITILLAIGVTIWYKHRKRIPYRITLRTLWRHAPEKV